MRKSTVLFTLVALAVAWCLPALAAQGGTGVKVRARVGGQIIIEIASGEEINFEVDPIMNPEDTATTEIIVRTNAAKYSIIAEFGEFLIGDYDLIAHGKFFVRSKAPGTGKAIDEWTVPKGQVVILKDEDGLTPGETTIVEYLLKVDFTVPPGVGKLEITFTAVPSF
ncbi:hypothetical protein ACVNPS_03755 [Candidatus Bipolaricaulota sp. J31]